MASRPTTPMKGTTTAPSDPLLASLPVTWGTALAGVQQLFPGSMIAGGALRDLDNGRPIKDIDIFAPHCDDLQATTRLAESLTKAPLKVLSSEMRVSPEGRVYTEWAANDLLAIFDIYTGELEYQLIALKGSASDILERIDFGLCRIAYDGEKIIRTPEYEADKAQGCFTLHRCDDGSQYDRSFRRHERFQAKYAGWPMKVAERFKSDCAEHNVFEGCFCPFFT